MSKTVKNCQKLSKIFKLVKKCQKCQNSQKGQKLSKMSKLSKIVQTIKHCENCKNCQNCENCWKMSKIVKMLVRSCFLITLIKCLKGHKSLGSLCNVKSKSDWLSESVTRSPIELLWTAKNQNMQIRVSWVGQSTRAHCPPSPQVYKGVRGYDFKF